MVDNTRFHPAPESHATLEEREAGLRLLASSQQVVPPNGIQIKIDEVGDLKTNGTNGVSKEFVAMQTEIEQEYRQIQEERARLRREERTGAQLDDHLLGQHRTLSQQPAPGGDMVWDRVLGYAGARHEAWMENRELVVARQNNYRNVTTAFMTSESDLRQVQRNYDRAFQLEKQGKRAEALQLLKDADRTLDTSLNTLKGSSHLAHYQNPNSKVPSLYDNAERNAERAHIGLVTTRSVTRKGLAAAPGVGPALAVASSVVGNGIVMIDSERHGTPMRQAGSEFLSTTRSELTEIAVIAGARKLGATTTQIVGAGIGARLGGRVVESTVNEVATRTSEGKPVFTRTLPVDIAAGTVDFGRSKTGGVRGAVATAARRTAEIGTEIGLQQISADADSSAVDEGVDKVASATVKESIARRVRRR